MSGIMENLSQCSFKGHLFLLVGLLLELTPHRVCPEFQSLEQYCEDFWPICNSPFKLNKRLQKRNLCHYFKYTTRVASHKK